MKMILINNNSAIECWERGLAAESSPVHPRKDVSFTGNVSDLANLAGSIPPISRPISIAVDKSEKRNHADGWHCQVWSKPFPEGSIYQIGETGVCLSAPWFCFLQMAARMSLPAAVQLGMELCGSYSTLPFSWGTACAYPMTQRERENGFVNSPPIADAGLLRSEISRVLPDSSRSMVRKAARYIADNSRSPAETRLYILLCLLVRYGGFGLPQPLLNARIAIPPELQSIAGKHCYLCDQYYPEGRLAVEFDGAYHWQGGQRMDDNLRELILGKLGIRVLRIDRKQIASPLAMELRAAEIARILGRRMRTPEENAQRARARLRAQVLDWGRRVY